MSGPVAFELFCRARKTGASEKVQHHNIFYISISDNRSVLAELAVGKRAVWLCFPAVVSF